jgi:hypothetical protein
LQHFQQQLAKPEWPRILPSTGIEGTIVRAPRRTSMQACDSALGAMVANGQINSYEHFQTEADGSLLFVLLRPLRSHSPRRAAAGKKQG